MGQITTKNYQKSCIFDFTVNGGAIGTIDLGTSVPGGDTIVSIYYTVISPILTVAVNVDAGFKFLGGVGFIKAAHTVAVLNAAMGTWFINDTYALRKNAVGTTNNIEIMLSTASLITGGSLLFSFTIMQHPL
jgi:hypothetical protein